MMREPNFLLRVSSLPTGSLQKVAGIAAAIIVFGLIFSWPTSRLSAADPAVVVLDDFNAGLDPAWRHEEFKGQNRYSIVELDGDKVLEGESSASASALVLKKKYQLQDYPILAWRWKIADILSDGDARSKSGDDYAARIYVVFPHWFTPKTRSINYIWANKLPKGAELPNSYASNSILVAVQSGREKVGRWMSERRNVLEDYRRIFGEEPAAVGAIAIMTDSDDTRGHSLAWFDDLRLEQQ